MAKPAPKWYDICNNPNDFFTLEPFADTDENETIKIVFIDQNKTECHNSEYLRKYFTDIYENKNYMVAWIKNPESRLPKVESSGHGSVPTSYPAYFYHNPGEFGGYFTEIIINKILRGEKSIRVKIHDERIALGNVAGEFGISMLHGQLPGVPIFRDENELFVRQVWHIRTKDVVYHDLNTNIPKLALNRCDENCIRVFLSSESSRATTHSESNISIKIDPKEFINRPPIKSIDHDTGKLVLYNLDDYYIVDARFRELILHRLSYKSLNDITLMPIRILNENGIILSTSSIFTPDPVVTGIDLSANILAEKLRSINDKYIHNPDIFDNFNIFLEILNDSDVNVFNENPEIENQIRDIKIIVIILRTMRKLTNAKYVEKLLQNIEKDPYYTILRRAYMNVMEKFNDRKNCSNKTTFNDIKSDTINLKTFVSIKDPSNDKTYCYDLNELVIYLLKYGNINPYNNLPFWNNRDEFDDIFRFMGVDNSPAIKVLKDRFFPQKGSVNEFVNRPVNIDHRSIANLRIGLIDAIDANAYNDVKEILKIIDPNFLNDADWAPIHTASYAGNIDIVKLLIDAGANVDIVGANDFTALHFATNGNHPDIVKLLIDTGININAVTKYKMTAVNLAISKNRDIVEILINAHANLDIANIKGETPIMYAIREGRDMVKLLIDAGANVNVFDKDSWSALHIASDENFTDIVELLIDAGADVDVSNKDGWSPLHIAVNKSFIDMVKLLINAGADVKKEIKIASGKNWTPLHFASRRDNTEIVKLLIDAGADVNAVDIGGFKPLTYASNNEMKTLLMNAGGTLR